MKFVRQAWYVAGWSSEFTRSITRITIMNENIALYTELKQERSWLSKTVVHTNRSRFLWGG